MTNYDKNDTINTKESVFKIKIGGVWTYGEGSGGGWAFSNYYHGKKYHYSSLVSRWDSHSNKGEAVAGETSEAWIWTKFGEQVSFYYDYDD